MPRNNKRKFDMNEVATNGLKGLPQLNREQSDLLVDYINHCGDTRKEAQGPNMSEADWIACGMAVLQAFGIWGRVPAAWVFGPLSGRTIYGNDRQMGRPADDEPHDSTTNEPKKDQ